MKIKNEVVQIDGIDKKILRYLMEDARKPILEIARQIGISGAAIHQRIQRLAKIGVISGSEFIINPKKIGFNTCAYLGVFLDSASLYPQVVTKLKEIKEITQCHYITGNYSIFIKTILTL